MLSPYKLYKNDKSLIHMADPAGTALCTRHYNVDWTVHRLTPAVIYRSHPKVQKGLGKGLAAISQRTRDGKLKNAPPKFRKDPAKVLADTSPRWGERGKFATGQTAPIPKKGQVDLSKKTKAAVAAASTAGVVDSNPHQVFYTEVNKYTKTWKTRRAKYGPKGHK